MPLLASHQTVTPDPPVRHPGVRPPLVRPDSYYVSWTPVGGAERELTPKNPLSGIMLGAVNGHGEIVGVDMPPEEQFRVELGGGDGAVFKGALSPSRPVKLPVVVQGRTLDEVESNRRTLMLEFNRRRGPGVLSWQLPGGQLRTLTCLYESGLESPIEGRTGAGRNLVSSYDLILRADDPYWYGAEREVSFRPAGESFDDPLLPGPPFTIAGPGPGGVREVMIDGEVDTSPVLVMVGPMVSATWTHLDLDVSLSLSPNLLVGQTLVVRTGPGVDAQSRFVREGQNVWGVVAGDFPPLRPWVLTPGPNRIETSFSGTAEGSDASLTYRTRYLTA